MKCISNLFFHYLDRGGQQAALSRDSSARRIANGNNTRRYRGIGIGASGLILPRRSNDTDDNEDDEEDIEEGRERRGFDRLRAVSHLTIYFVLSMF
jgi:hypothetical protein